MELIKPEQKIKEQRSKTLWRHTVIVLSLFFLSLFLVPASGQCQSWNEVFKQKETQKKYLLEQIVALKVYAGYLKKGYDLTSSGLQTVKGITKGEFSLHNAFISSLKTVSPFIRNNAKVAEIITLQIEIGKTFGSIKNNKWLDASHLDYIQNIREKIMDECGKDLEELLLVVTSGKVKMTDDERIKRLNKVYAAMKDKSAFTQSLCNEAGLLIRQKENEQRSINQLKEHDGTN